MSGVFSKKAKSTSDAKAPRKRPVSPSFATRSLPLKNWSRSKKKLHFESRGWKEEEKGSKKNGSSMRANKLRKLQSCKYRRDRFSTSASKRKLQSMDAIASLPA